MTDGKSLRARREALGWSRKDLAIRAVLDPSIIQVVELGHFTADEAFAKIEAALAAEEAARPKA